MNDVKGLTVPIFKSQLEAVEYRRNLQQKESLLQSSCYLLEKMRRAKELLDSEGDTDILRSLLGVSLDRHEVSVESLRYNIDKTISLAHSVK